MLGARKYKKIRSAQHQILFYNKFQPQDLYKMTLIGPKNSCPLTIVFDASLNCRSLGLRIEAHYSIHRSKNGLPFFLSSIPSSFRTQEKLGEPLEAWEHIAGNTYYCCLGCFTVEVVSTLSCAILNGVSFLESLRLYKLL